MAFTVPESGIFDEPNRTFSVNQEWLSYIDGAIGFLLIEYLWDGSDEDREFAEQQIRQLLAQFVTPPPQTLFGYNTPDFEGSTTSAPGNLGIRFRAAVPGVIRAIKFWRISGSSNGHHGYLFNSDGSTIDNAPFPDNEDGWTLAVFDPPVPISAETDYIAAVYAPDASYAYRFNFFASNVTNGDLTAPASSGGAPNGVFNTSVAGSFPTTGFMAINFYVDVEFVPE